MVLSRRCRLYLGGVDELSCISCYLPWSRVLQALERGFLDRKVFYRLGEKLSHSPPTRYERVRAAPTAEPGPHSAQAPVRFSGTGGSRASATPPDRLTRPSCARPPGARDRREFDVRVSLAQNVSGSFVSADLSHI